jgi:phosphoserine phosphatase
MDGVLLNGRFVVTLAERANKSSELATLLDNPCLPANERTRRIAGLFLGVPKSLFEQTAREIPLHEGARETIISLRKAGYRVGIITDTYWIASEIVRRRVFADLSIAHFMKFRAGKATGKVALSLAMVHPQGCPHHIHCKVNAMRYLLDKLGIAAGQVLAVGDGDNDVCMLRAAGHSFAYQPKTAHVRAAATKVIHSLNQVLSVLGEDGGTTHEPWQCIIQHNFHLGEQRAEPLAS